MRAAQPRWLRRRRTRRTPCAPCCRTSRRARPFFGLLLPQLIAGKARIDVGPPRAEIHRAAHRLTEFAVVHDIDAALHLAAYDVADRGAQSRLKRSRRTHYPGRAPSSRPDAAGCQRAWSELARCCASSCLSPYMSLSPELAGREFCALCESLELCPSNLGMNPTTEPAVGAGDDVFAANDLGKADDPVGH